MFGINLLIDVIRQRRHATPNTSYVASLHHQGINKILEKVGEEAIEVVIAAKDAGRSEVVKETADLWFHTFVVLSHLDIAHTEVFDELARRFAGIRTAA